MDTLLNQKIGTRIKTLRNSKGLTQEKLAEAANLSPSYISRVENGDSVASLDSLHSIASAMHVGIESFLCDLFIVDPENKTVREISISVAALSPDKQKAALQYIKYLHATEELL